MKSKQYAKMKYQILHNLKILFIGINPSPGTYRRRIPFSNNKSFWYLLSDAMLIPETRKELKNDKFLKELYTKKFTKIYNLGITNLVSRPTKTISELKKEEAIPGAKRIIRIIKRYTPNIVCFIGKGTYQLFSQTNNCTYGWQPQIDSSKIYVMHNPLHGLASIRVNELKEIGKSAGIL